MLPEAFSLVCVTKPAAGAGIVFVMTVNTGSHGRDIDCLRHDLHLIDLAVTLLTGHLGFQMRAMIPVNPAGNNIDTNPGNRLVGLCELCKLSDGGFVLRDRDMTNHAFCRRRKRHAIAGFGIWVALLTLQPER